jgi:polyisoprenoid-binding protein YceI
MRLALALAIGLFAPAALAADTYNIDPVHSTVIFGISHLGFSYTFGRFEDVSGDFALDDATPANSKATLVARIDSVDTNAEKRDTHLKSPDFFDAKQFPTLTWTGKTFTHNADGTWSVTGDLTMHGVTRSVTVPVKKVGEGNDPWGGHRAGYLSEFTVKRSDFGMNFMSDKIGDEVRLIVSVEGIKKVL